MINYMYIHLYIVGELFALLSELRMAYTVTVHCF